MGVEFAAHKPPFRRGPSFAPRRRRPDSSPGGASRLRDSAGFQPVFAALRSTRASGPGHTSCITDARRPATRGSALRDRAPAWRTPSDVGLVFGARAPFLVHD